MDDYDCEEDAKDEDFLSHEVVTEVKEGEYYDCVAKSNEEQSETENPPVPSITIEIDGHHDYDHEDADDDLSRKVAILGKQEKYFECVAESDEVSSNSTYLSAYSPSQAVFPDLTRSRLKPKILLSLQLLLNLLDITTIKKKIPKTKIVTTTIRITYHLTMLRNNPSVLMRRRTPVRVKLKILLSPPLLILSCLDLTECLIILGMS
jgi:hypothetical protein